MKKMIAMLVTLSLLLLPMLALADSTMRVQGNATLSVAPDTAFLTVGHMNENTDPSTAQETTAAVITSIVEAVKALGIAEDDITTASINTYPMYNYTDNGQTLRGYNVEHLLRITVSDLTIVGDVLDAALNAGANVANSITYQSSKEKEVYLQALALAIENAGTKAEAMSVATGTWLGDLEEVNEVGSYAALRYGEEAMYDMAGGSLGSTLRTGNLEVSATVELVYNIR